MRYTLTEITTARQMKRLAKEAKKKEKAMQKMEKENGVSNPLVIREIIERAKNSSLSLKSRFYLIYVPYDNEDDEDLEIMRELGKNFEAYKRDFRELGYCLKRQHDACGTGYSIQW